MIFLGDDLEDRLRISSDEEDMDQGQDSDMYILNQRSNNGGPVGVGPEHLVKPSQFKQNSRDRSSSSKKDHQRSHHHSRQSSQQQQQPPPGE
jgi:hypothetical protein